MLAGAVVSNDPCVSKPQRFHTKQVVAHVCAALKASLDEKQFQLFNSGAPGLPSCKRLVSPSTCWGMMNLPSPSGGACS